jgi:hypothetical protein
MLYVSRTITRSVAGACAVAAIAAPAAGARLSDEETGVAPARAATSSSQVDPSSAPAITQPADDGFDWSAAAIGGGAIVAVLFAAGGAVALTDHRRHAHHPIG